ncbi:MAG: hypothetical protein K6G87_14675 [Butyrivibrio sp.]|uniref:hypothetical protein n=1 Tax=Butyrivibrio sp. TaxID=28121 RepID=UPI0025F6E8B8|nr:hypothetical protein [Butyrivibrio sp.]MCR5772462.1 hypothetical protein [Butyrivibrio sp.]
MAIQQSLNNPKLYNKDTGKYTTHWTLNIFDEFCQHRLHELVEAEIVELEEIKDSNGNIDYTVTLNINMEDGLSQDEIDALMCVITGNPTLLSFGAETQAHADIYSKGGLYNWNEIGFSTIIADAGVDEDSGWTPEDPYKMYYSYEIDFDDPSIPTVEVNKGSYIVNQENAFGDDAYEYIDGYK